MKQQRSWYWLLVLVCLTMGPYGVSSSYAQKTESEEDAVPVEFAPVVELDREVHFLTPQGEDTVVSSGMYTVEAAEGGLRLTPSDEADGNAVIIKAEATSHEKSIESSQPVSMAGEEDQHVVMLLLPNGKAMQAVGSYSGVQARGFKGGLKLPTGALATYPKITSILAIPPDNRPLPPLGSITPFGTLYIKGERFGVFKRFKSPGGRGGKGGKGNVTLQVKVPIGEHFRVKIGGEEQTPLVGPKPGIWRIPLQVQRWKDNRITVKIPLVFGVPDQPAVLQIRTHTGKPSIGWKVSFYAIRANTYLKPREAVTKIICSKAGDRNNCKGDPKDATGSFKIGCLTDIWTHGHLKIKKTISSYHVNCDRAIDWDEGIDMYTIKLKKNGWVIKSMEWGMKENSGSDKVYLPKKKNVNQPDNEALTKKHKGRAITTIRVPWKASPGPDWLSYWIHIQVEGPAGTLFGDRVWWEK